jgi:hypothetical protein
MKYGKMFYQDCEAKEWEASAKQVKTHRSTGSIFRVIVLVKIVFSGIGVVDARKKLGGSVFSRNRGGNYIRRRVVPINRNTTSQRGSRTRFTGLSQGWRGLTATQQTAWNNATGNFPRKDRLGNTIVLSGANLYQSLNNTLINAGIATIATPPIASTIVGPATFSATYVAGVSTLTFTATPVPTGQAYLVFATRGLSPGVSFVKSQFRLITTFAAAAASPQIVTTPYIAKFGAVVVGQKVFFQLIPVSTVSGQKTKGLVASVIAS